MTDRQLARPATASLAAILACAAAGVSLAQGSPSGREIMEKVTLTRKLEGSEAVVTMRIINQAGQTRERKLAMATKLYDGGKTEKRIYRFLSPPDIKGTGILVFDHETEADDIWVYLPALRKTRRVVSSQRNQSFMGSEFSYADLNVPVLDDYTYKVLKEEAAGGEPCWVIDVMPKSAAIASSEGYSKKTYWVSKAKLAVRKALFYDGSGRLLKELTTDDVKLLDPKNKRYRALHMEMVNKQNGRRSVFDTDKIAFTPKTDDENFTTRRLEQL